MSPLKIVVEPPLAVMTVRLRPQDVDALEHLAKRYGAPRGTVLRKLLEEALEREAAA